MPQPQATQISQPDFLIQKVRQIPLVKGDLLKSNSIYKPYKKGELSGIAARPLCAFLWNAANRLDQEITNIGGSDRLSTGERWGLGNIKKKTDELLNLIADHQQQGFLDYKSQKVIKRIYEQLGDLLSDAKYLRKFSQQPMQFDPEEVYRELKRFFLAQAMKYLADFAHSNAKDLPIILPGEGAESAFMAAGGAGHVSAVPGVVGVSVGATVGVNGKRTTMRRGDDNTDIDMESLTGAGGVTVKTGVAPLPNLAPPTGHVGDTAINIAGAYGTAQFEMGRRRGKQYTPENKWPLEVEEEYADGGVKANTTKSSSILNWLRDAWRSFKSVFRGRSLAKYRIKSEIFSGADSKKVKSTMSIFKKAMKKNGIDISMITYVPVNIQSEEQKKAAHRDKYDKYIAGELSLSAKRIATLSGTVMTGSLGVGAGISTIASAALSGSFSRTIFDEFRFLNTAISIKDQEGDAVRSANQNLYQQLSSEVAKNFSNMSNDNFFDAIYSVLKDIEEITIKINRRENDVRSLLDPLFDTLFQQGLMPVGDRSDQELLQYLASDPDHLKAYVIHAYCNFLVAYYDVYKQSHPDPKDQEKKNKELAGILSFAIDCAWGDRTGAHRSALESYHKKIWGPGPTNPIEVQTASFGGSFTVGPKIPGHGRTDTLSLATAGVTVTYEKTKNHPAPMRNKEEVMVTLALSGAIVDAGVLTASLKDWIENNTPFRDKSDAIARATITALYAYNISAVDKASGAHVVTHGILASKIPANNITFRVNFNLTTKETDYSQLLLTKNWGLGFNTADIGYFLGPLLPVVPIAQVGISNSETSTLGYKTSGTTSILGFIRSICSGFKGISEFKTMKDDKTIAFLRKLKNDNQFLGLQELGNRGLENKVLAKKMVGVFDRVAQQGGIDCLNHNTKIKEAFSQATELDENMVRSYNNAIKKLLVSKDFDVEINALNEQEWKAVGYILKIWKNVNDAYTQLDLAHKKSIGLHYQTGQEIQGALDIRAKNNKATSLVQQGSSVPRDYVYR